MLPVEAMKYSANIIADVGHQYEHYIGKLSDRDKCVAKYFSVIRRGKKSETVDGTHVLLAAIPSEKGDFVRWRFVNCRRNVDTCDTNANRDLTRNTFLTLKTCHVIQPSDSRTSLRDQCLFLLCTHFVEFCYSLGFGTTGVSGDS